MSLTYWWDVAADGLSEAGQAQATATIVPQYKPDRKF